MKKKNLFLLTILIFMISILTPNFYVRAGILTEEKAKKLALKDANLENNKVKSLSVEYDSNDDNKSIIKEKLTKDDGIKIYDLKFYMNDMEYEYEINAKNGKILEFSSEAIDDEYDD